MKHLKINPELQRLIPPLTVDEFNQLEANILAEGIRESVIVWQDTIVDGHNRYQIAQRHNLEYDTSEMYFKSLDDCKEWMILNQFGRRNLSNYQRSVLALALEQVFRDKAKENLKLSEGRGKKGCQNSDNLIDKIDTKKEVAKVASVSHDTIAKVKQIEAKAPEEVKEKLRTGEVSINQAYQDIRKQEKAEILQERKAREINDAGQQISVNEEYNVKQGDVWKLGRHTLICGTGYEFVDQEIDAIITDPPYGIDYNPDWLRADGSENNFKKIHDDDIEFDPRPFLQLDKIVLFGANYYTKHLPLGSWICWDKRVKDEADTMFGSPFELAWFKSPMTKKSSIMIRVMHGGLVNADLAYGYTVTRSHPTQKPILLFEDIINQLTKSTDIICDPFCGSGTTLLAAENTGRTCIAYEIEPSYCNVILSRFYSLTKVHPCRV
jgi:DNA modification methylase